MHEQAQGDFMHPRAFGKGERLANKAAERLTQGTVPAFDMTGLAGFFAAQAMGTSWEDLLVGQPEVAPGRAAAIIRRNAS